MLGYIARIFPKAELAPGRRFLRLFQMQSFNLYLASTIHITFAHLFRPERYADSDRPRPTCRPRCRTWRATVGWSRNTWPTDANGCMGARYTVSDPYLYVFARWLDREGAGGSSGMPLTRAHRARMQERPAVKKVLAEEGIAPV